MKLGSELALQVDLAAAVIAVLALLFSIRAGMRQRRHECETLHLQRNSDIIAWSNACLAGLCQGEMLLRPERRSLGSRVPGIDHRDRKIVEMAHVAGGYGGPSAGGNPGDLGVPKAGWTTSLPAIRFSVVKVSLTRWTSLPAWARTFSSLTRSRSTFGKAAGVFVTSRLKFSMSSAERRT